MSLENFEDSQCDERINLLADAYQQLSDDEYTENQYWEVIMQEETTQREYIDRYYKTLAWIDDRGKLYNLDKDHICNMKKNSYISFKANYFPEEYGVFNKRKWLDEY